MSVYAQGKGESTSFNNWIFVKCLYFIIKFLSINTRLKINNMFSGLLPLPGNSRGHGGCESTQQFQNFLVFQHTFYRFAILPISTPFVNQNIWYLKTIWNWFYLGSKETFLVSCNTSRYAIFTHILFGKLITFFRCTIILTNLFIFNENNHWIRLKFLPMKLNNCCSQMPQEDPQ